MRLFTLLASLLGLAAAADVSGCGKQPPGALNVTVTFNLTSISLRSYLVHAPVGYDNNHKYPVVFAFHGNPESAGELELDTRLSDPKWSKDVWPHHLLTTMDGR